MKELKLGVVSYTELAEWFGISRIHSKQKESRLKELRQFCRYELTNSGKVNILEIYEPIYVKQRERIMAAAEDYLQYFNNIRPGEYVGTAIQVAKILIRKYHFDVSPEYVAKFISAPLKRDYGNMKTKGIRGTKKYTWLKCSTNRLNPRCEELTKEELEAMKNIVKEIFGSKEYAELAADIAEGKLTEEEIKEKAKQKNLELHERTKDYFKQQYYLVIRGSKLNDDTAIVL
jgi:hypothetical protein